LAYALPVFTTCALGLFGLAQMANSNDAAMAPNLAPTVDSGFSWIFVVVLLGSALLTTCMGLLLLRSVATPLARATESLRRLSTGDLDAFGGDTERADEIGDLARSLRYFKDDAMRRAELAAAEQEARRVRTGHLATLTEQLLGFEDQINETLNILTAAAVQMDVMTRQDNRSAQSTAVVAPASPGDELH